MNMNTKSLLMILSVLILAILACNSPTGVDPTVAPQVPTETAVVDPSTSQATATPTKPPTATLPPENEDPQPALF